ncbi:hypothetical protein OOK48_35055 [Streptomyces viridodiastaticus]|uniref:hypothetical protein n=1 Tax=Streptomyces albogriseolus TaxID=1887 RepID=UPI0022528A3F|nr:hypothetical protein [Streptomyces viridodiastaticus]MCX4571541.1 hypothetical protein [Streptomyces viridodiastaticus]
MSKKQEPSAYKLYACGYDCHPERYTVFTTRTRLGMKRWGIRDNHMDIRLSKLCKSRYAAEAWRISLATMEIRERQAIRQAPGLRDLWNTR